MTDLTDLLHQIEDEAEAEGPAGRAHFDESVTVATWSYRSPTAAASCTLRQQQVAAARFAPQAEARTPREH